MSKADARQIIINGSAIRPRLTMSPSPKPVSYTHLTLPTNREV